MVRRIRIILHRRLLSKRFFTNTRVGNNRGVALILAVTAVSMLTYLAMEVMYDSTVEYTVNSQGLNRLKAYYAAKAGLDISLLRIKIYQTVTTKFGDKMGAMGNYVDQIWQFPFAWPLPIPKDVSKMDRDDAAKLEKESTMDSSFSTTIQDEGSKIDLADLVSASKTLRELSKKRLLAILNRKFDDDDVWRHKYNPQLFEEVVNNIADWMSDKNTSLNGGNKNQGYEDLNKDSQAYPPNRAFRTIDEVRLVAKMNDDFFDLLSPQITIYGMRGINPNVASRDILKGLDKGMTDEVVDEIIKRRDDPQQGPFKTTEDFWGFAEQKGARLEDQDAKKIPMVFDALLSFRIKATGEFAGAVREIEVITTDLARTATKIKASIDKDKPATDPPECQRDQNSAACAQAKAAANGGQNGQPNTDQSKAQANTPLPKGPPRIVYWTER